MTRARRLASLGWVTLGLACPPAAGPPAPPAALPAPDWGLRGAPEATAARAEVARAADACREQVAGFRQWLAAVEAAGDPLANSLLDPAALVEHPGPPIAEPAPVVQIDASRLLVDGVSVDGPVAVGAQLARLIEARRAALEGSPFIADPFCYLAVDGGVEWERAVAVIEQVAKAGMSRVILVFADPGRLAPTPPASPIDDDLAKMRVASASRRQQLLAELLAYTYKDCPDGLRVIAQLGHEVADMKDVILGELPDAIEACRCAPNDASVRALHWALFGNPHPVAGFEVRLASVAAPPLSTVALAPTAPWRESFASLVGLGEDRQPVAVSVLAPESPPDKPPPKPPRNKR